MSDDLSMKALSGSYEQKTRRVLAAGCDLVLHCSGVLADMEKVAGAAKPLRGLAARRAAAALQRISHKPEPFDPVEGRDWFDQALAAIA